VEAADAPESKALAPRLPDPRVLVVSVDDEKAGRDRLVSGLGLELPVLRDGEYAIAETYRPASMSATVLLDANSEEIYRHSGSDEKDWLRFEAVGD
jgi:hypothetical protein